MCSTPNHQIFKSIKIQKADSLGSRPFGCSIFIFSVAAPAQKQIVSVDGYRLAVHGFFNGLIICKLLTKLLNPQKVTDRPPLPSVLLNRERLQQLAPVAG
jgi:hypothetical protein